MIMAQQAHAVLISASGHETAVTTGRKCEFLQVTDFRYHITRGGNDSTRWGLLLVTAHCSHSLDASRLVVEFCSVLLYYHESTFLILLHIILRRERLRFGLQRRIPPTSFTVHLQAVRLIVGTSTDAARQFSPKFPSPE